MQQYVEQIPALPRDNNADQNVSMWDTVLHSIGNAVAEHVLVQFTRLHATLDLG